MHAALPPFVPALMLAAVAALGLAPLAHAENGVTPPPPRPKPVDDYSPALGTVVYVGSGAGLPETEADRARELFNDTLGTGTPITIITTERSAAEVDALRGKGRVTVEPVADGNLTNTFGGGFARDNLPVTVTSTDDAGKTSYRYVIDTPQQGPGMVDAMIEAGILRKEEVVRAPFQFDGGDIVTQDGTLFVTDDFYRRNKDLKGLERDEVNRHVRDYLGVEPADIVELSRPPGEGTGHSDVLVRPLPNGKIVVSVPGSADMAEADRAALQENLRRVRERYGADKVVEIPTSGADPTGSYANAVITDRIVLVPQIGDEAADAAALERYREALPGYRIQPMESYDQCNKGGGPHCRIGTLTRKSARTKAAGVDKSPTLAFDAATGTMSITADPLSLLTGPDPARQSTTDPAFLSDPLLTLGVLLSVEPLTLAPFQPDPDVITFEGGRVALMLDGTALFSAQMPAMTFFRDMDAGYLDSFGILEDIEIDNVIGSDFLADFEREVLASTRFIDFYMLTRGSVFAASADFARSFEMDLRGAGLSLNGRTPAPPIPLPPSAALLAGALLATAALRAARRAARTAAPGFSH